MRLTIAAMMATEVFRSGAKKCTASTLHRRRHSQLRSLTLNGAMWELSSPSDPLMRGAAGGRKRCGSNGQKTK